MHLGLEMLSPKNCLQNAKHHPIPWGRRERNGRERKGREILKLVKIPNGIYSVFLKNLWRNTIESHSVVHR